jgi:hypothetical protein
LVEQEKKTPDISVEIGLLILIAIDRAEISQKTSTLEAWKAINSIGLQYRKAIHRNFGGFNPLNKTTSKRKFSM